MTQSLHQWTSRHALSQAEKNLLLCVPILRRFERWKRKANEKNSLQLTFGSPEVPNCRFSSTSLVSQQDSAPAQSRSERPTEP